MEALVPRSSISFRTLSKCCRGCVTPQQLFNLKDSVEDDLDGNLDGYSELDDFNKSKIAKAFEEGHVADDDWRGVSVLFLR